MSSHMPIKFKFMFKEFTALWATDQLGLFDNRYILCIQILGIKVNFFSMNVLMVDTQLVPPSK
jgi:hypothetical protein